MTRGKRTCKILKEIRQQIADNNDIEYAPSECHFQGECKGTCPKCEAEVKYLENELYKRRKLKKVVSIVGISLGIALTASACKDDDNLEGDPVITGDILSEYTEDSLYDNSQKETTIFIEDLENEDKNIQ